MRSSEPTILRNEMRVTVLLVALVILFWGLNWPFMKISLRSIGPFTLATMRLLLGAGVLFLFMAARGSVPRPTRQDLPVVLSVGVLQMGIFLGCVNIALQFVEAGRSSILSYTTPLWVLPGAALLLHERVGRTHLVGFLLGMVGIAVLFNPTNFDWTDPSVVFGNGLLLVAALAWAAQIIHIRGHVWDSSPLQLAPWQMLVGAVIIAPFAIVLEWGHPIDVTPVLVLLVLYNGIVATAFGVWASVTVNRRLPAATTSIVLLGVPVSGLICSFLLLGEALTVIKLLGLGLILGGVGVVSTTMAATRSRAVDTRTAPMPIEL